MDLIHAHHFSFLLVVISCLATNASQLLTIDQWQWWTFIHPSLDLHNLTISPIIMSSIISKQHINPQIECSPRNWPMWCAAGALGSMAGSTLTCSSFPRNSVTWCPRIAARQGSVPNVQVGLRSGPTSSLLDQTKRFGWSWWINGECMVDSWLVDGDGYLMLVNGY